MTRLPVLAAALLVAAASSAARANPQFNFDWAGAVEVDAEGLQSDNPKTRLEAVTALLGHDIAYTKAYLLKAAASDDDQAVRLAAAKGLGTGGAREAVPMLVEWLADFDPKVRVVAADALGDIGGADATAALVRSLGDNEYTVRQHAVRSLGTIGKQGNASVVIAIIPRLEDEKADVKREAIEQLEALGDKRAVIPLVARINESSPALVTAAVRAIGRLGDKAAVPALVRTMTNDQREEVKTACVGALGQLGALDAIDALTEQLAVGSQAYRDKVAYALGQIAATPGAGKTGEDAMRTLVGSLADPTKRRGAREALTIAGKTAVPALVLHLEGRLPGDPTTAVELLAAAGDPRATAALTSELERGRVAMPEVLKALGATGDPAALVPMLGALANKEPTIRLAAMESLRPIIGRDARAGDVLVDHLGDDDLEIRVLAAEYLGILAPPSATPKLVALAAPGTPIRLRLAAIDALGQISAATHQPVATKVLLDVLKDGASELHRSAATALAYAADPAAVPQLVALAKAPDKGRDAPSTRHEIVRALAATVRAHKDNAAGKQALAQLVDDGNLKVSLAAIAGLAAVGDDRDRKQLRKMIETSAADRQRAAVWAAGELHDTGAIAALTTAMTPQTDRLLSDRLAGDAAWALGEIAVAAPSTPELGAIADRWLYAAKFGGWAAAIDGAGALARTLVALPAAQRAQLVGPRRANIVGMAFHKSRLVRLNACIALGTLDGDDVVRDLSQLALGDPSVHVRIAAVRALATRVGVDSVKKLLGQLSGDGEADADVKAAAKAALAGAPKLPARNDWRNFYVVDPSADDAAVRQEPYFVHTSDGLVWATYTDARGEIDTEHIPSDTDGSALHPGSRELEY